jgi:anion-transporting  ArsA/GET3 family ATPase
MAMEKLYAIKRDSSFDLIVLDTPPTTNALDFLDAPDRMIDALDSGVTKWFVTAFEASRKLSFNLLARSTAIILKGIGRLTGGGLLESMAELVTDLNELFGGFKNRAREVAEGLRAADVAYVLVTSPDPMSVREVLYFSDRLREQGMPRDAFVVNRVHRADQGQVRVEDVQRALDARGIDLGTGGAERVAQAMRDEHKEAELDRMHLAELGRALEGESPPPIRVDVPAYAGDVHDLEALARVAKTLAPKMAAPPG